MEAQQWMVAERHPGCTSVLVPIPDFIRADPMCFYGFDATHPEYGIDDEGRECFRMDGCIVDAVLALWAKGIKTTGCCCGHGSGSGVIGLLTFRDDTPINDHPEPYRPADDVEMRYGKLQTLNR